MSEYLNTFVMRDGHAYRVVFHAPTRKAMLVRRKTKGDEISLNVSGPTGAAVIELARRQVWPLSKSESHNHSEKEA